MPITKKNYIKCEWGCGSVVAPQCTYPIRMVGVIMVNNACIGCMLENNFIYNIK